MEAWHTALLPVEGRGRQFPACLVHLLHMDTLSLQHSLDWVLCTVATGMIRAQIYCFIAARTDLNNCFGDAQTCANGGSSRKCMKHFFESPENP